MTAPCWLEQHTSSKAGEAEESKLSTDYPQEIHKCVCLINLPPKSVKCHIHGVYVGNIWEDVRYTVYTYVFVKHFSSETVASLVRSIAEVCKILESEAVIPRLFDIIQSCPVKDHRPCLCLSQISQQAELSGS